MSIIAGIGAALSGILAGGGASILTKGLNIGEKLMLAKQEIKLKQLEHEQTMALHRMQLEMNSAEFAYEASIENTRASAAAFEASYEHDASYGQVLPWAATALRFVRPTLTAGLLIWTAILVGRSTNMDIFDADDVRGFIEQVIFLTGTAVSWWFGGRQMEKQSQGME